MDPVSQFPEAAFALGVPIVALAVYVVWRLLRYGYPGYPRPVMRMLGAVLIASTLVGLGSALRLLVADSNGVGDADRVLRISLIALRVFVLGSLVQIAWDLRKSRRR